MYDRHLESFVRVVESGSFSKAAEDSFVSPNALIKQINLLERDIGVELLMRTNRGVEPTPAGAFLYDKAKTFIRESKAVMEEARGMADVEIQTIRLATSQLRPVKRIAMWWRAIETKHPNLKLSLVPVPDDVRRWPKYFHEFGSEIDVAVAVEPSPAWDWYEKCRMKTLYHASSLCMVPFNHRLSGKPLVTFEDLHGEIVWMAHEGSTPSADAKIAYIKRDHPQVRIRYYDPYDISVFNQITESNAVGFVCSEWKDVHPSFEYIPLEGSWNIPICLLYPHECSQAVMEFVDAIIEASAAFPIEKP